MTWRKFDNKANTPLKRVGLILLAGSILLWVGTAAHWNITRHGFIYQYKYTWTEKIPKPTENHEGAFWRNDSYGWVLYDKSCIAADRASGNNSFVYMPPRSCRIKFIPHRQRVKYEWKQSFNGFIKESFDSRWGKYFWFNATGTVALFLGVFTFFGWADKLLSWVRAGSQKS